MISAKNKVEVFLLEFHNVGDGSKVNEVFDFLLGSYSFECERKLIKLAEKI